MLIDYAMTGDDHKRHRRIMTPAFGAKESKAFVPLFFAYAAKVFSPFSFPKTSILPLNNSCAAWEQMERYTYRFTKGRVCIQRR
jgi:hypothetical protein